MDGRIYSRIAHNCSGIAFSAKLARFMSYHMAGLIDGAALDCVAQWAYICLSGLAGHARNPSPSTRLL